MAAGTKLILRYRKGPLLCVDEGDDHSWSVFDFKSDFCGKRGTIKQGTMHDSSAVVAGLYGRRGKCSSATPYFATGRVVLISPHPAHSEPAMQLCYTNMVRWASGHQALATDQHVPALRGHSAASLRLAWVAARQLVFKHNVCATEKRRTLKALLRAPEMKNAVDAVRRQGGHLGPRSKLFAQGDGQSPRHLSKTAPRSAVCCRASKPSLHISNSIRTYVYQLG